VLPGSYCLVAPTKTRTGWPGGFCCIKWYL